MHRPIFLPRGGSILSSLLCLVLTSTPARAQWQPWMLGPFEKPKTVNPVITPGSSRTFLSPMNDSVVQWEGFATFNPAAVVKDGKVFVLYRAEDASGEQIIGHHTSRIGLAESSDGLRFTRRDAPVLYPDKDVQARYEWTGGVEDPRIVATDDGRYVLTYTQWNRDIPRLAIATSRDLVHWTKHGPAFAAADSGKYRSFECKSGAILARVVGDRVVATKVNGKYWMYFNVPDILIATSDNLVDWTPLEDTNGKLVKVYTGKQAVAAGVLVLDADPPDVDVVLAGDVWYERELAARVLDWLEEWQQTEWPQLRVWFTSVTEVPWLGKRASAS